MSSVEQDFKNFSNAPYTVKCLNWYGWYLIHIRPEQTPIY